MLQSYADTVDEAFVQQYDLADTTPRYTAKWALCELLGLMHRYLQVCVCVYCGAGQHCTAVCVRM